MVNLRGGVNMPIRFANKLQDLLFAEPTLQQPQQPMLQYAPFKAAFSYYAQPENPPCAANSQFPSGRCPLWN